MEKTTNIPKIAFPQYLIKSIESEFGVITSINKSLVALTNSVFFIETSYKKLVLKIFNPTSKKLFSIPQQKKIMDYLGEKNITPKYFLFSNKYCLLEFIEGESLSQDNMDENLIINMANIIQTIHNSKLKINVRNFEKTAAKYLKKTPQKYLDNKVVIDTIKQSEKLFYYISKFKKEYCVCHDDLNANNFLKNRDELKVIDFEYAAINDKYFDFAYVQALIGEEKFKTFINHYGEKINEEKLFGYRIMLDFFSAIWCFMMLASPKAKEYDYFSEGKYYYNLMINKLSII